MMLDGTFRRTRLPNGLRIVTEQVPFVRSVSLGVWVQVGSRDEASEEQGLSHFLEHMLFKGTESRSAFDIVHALESRGGTLDAFTSRDLTCFYVRCLDEHVEAALDVLSDMVLNPALDPGEIEKEKSVVLDEIQNVDDTPEDLMHDLFAKAIWGGHPVGAPILGTPETVRSFSRSKMAAFHSERYSPDRIVISAAGLLDHERILEQVARHFPGNGPSGPLLRRDPPEVPERTVRHVRRDIGQTHICLGRMAYAYTTPKRYEFMLANTLLGEGMSSRLFQQVRERLGLAYSVYSYTEMLEDTGLFGTYVACDQSRVDQAVETVRHELEELKQGNIGEEEISSARAQLRGELVLGMESMGNRMTRLADDEIYSGDYVTAADSLAAIDRVTVSGVREVCEELLDDGKMHVVSVGP